MSSAEIFTRSAEHKLKYILYSNKLKVIFLHKNNTFKFNDNNVMLSISLHKNNTPNINDDNIMLS